MVCAAQTQLATESRDRAAREGGDHVALLPATIGDYRIGEHWRNALPLGALEEGAIYSPALSDRTADPIQLDFFRNSRSAHNGIGCYLTKGEAPLRRTLRGVRLHDTTAVFDVAVLLADNRLRLVAATECTGHSCSEEGLSAEDGRHWRVHIGFPSSRRDGVVPFSLVLTRAIGAEGIDSAQSRLLDEFELLATQIDLIPAQHLAQMQAAPQPSVSNSFARGMSR